jgi:Zn-finger nucleic acid-binding protein
MVEVELHGECVDKCPLCDGIFFDRGELESIIHIVDLFRSVKLNEPEIDDVPECEHKRIVRCPDDGSEMEPNEIGGLTIDICQKCGGIWLDHGEIAVLKVTENHIKNNLQLYIRLGEGQ